MSTPEVRDWISAYRRFLADPGAPPAAGDDPVPRIGAPLLRVRAVATRGAPLTLAVNRPGRAVIRLIPLTGPRRGDARVIAALPFARPGSRVARLPRDVRPGRYRLRVTFQGEGTRERMRRDITIAG